MSMLLTAALPTVELPLEEELLLDADELLLDADELLLDTDELLLDADELLPDEGGLLNEDELLVDEDELLLEALALLFDGGVLEVTAAPAAGEVLGGPPLSLLLPLPQAASAPASKAQMGAAKTL